MTEFLKEWVWLAPIGILLVGIVGLLLRNSEGKASKSVLKPIRHTPDADLTGRDADIEALREHFKFSRKPLAIHGGPGIGKTVLARKYAATNYKGWVMLPLTSDSEMKTALERVASQLGVEDTGDIDAFIRVTLDKMCRAKTRWLVILDNADSDAEAARALKYTLDTNDLDFLITSQRQVWPETIKSYPLEVLSADHAAALLSRLSKREVDAELRALAKDLDYLPLALTLIGTDLADHTGSLADYAQSFEVLLDKAPENTPYKKSVVTAVLMAFERLGTEVQELLNLAAFMDPNDIHADFFIKGADGINACSDIQPLPEPLWTLIQDRLALSRALVQARNHSLLYPTTWRDADTYRIHRTTQKVLRAYMGEAELPKYVGYLARLVRVQVGNNIQYDVKAWPAYHRLTPQAEALLPWGESVPDADGGYLAYLFNALAVFVNHATGDWARQMGLDAGAVTLAARIWGMSSQGYASYLGNTAVTQGKAALTLSGPARQALDDKAEAAFRQAIEIKKNIQGTELSRAYMHNNLGFFYHARHRLEDAEVELKIACDLRENYKASPHILATTYGNLGAVYTVMARRAERPETEKPYSEQALDYTLKATNLTRIALGEFHRDTATRYNNLSVDFNDREDFETGLIFAIRACAILEGMVRVGQLSADHPDIARYHDRLAVSLKNLGRRRQEAQTLIDAILPDLRAQHAAWQATKDNEALDSYTPPPLLPDGSV